MRAVVYRWWTDPLWRSIRRWLAFGMVVMVAWSALVAGLAAAQRAAAASSTTAGPVAETVAHAFDPLIAEVAADLMPPRWDWRLLKAMVRQESNYDAGAVSPGGAVGLTQMLPATARHMGLNSRHFHDPEANLRAGTAYLRSIYDRFHAVPDEPPHWYRTRLAISGYNAGPARARRALEAAGSYRWSAVARHLPQSTQQHIRKIVDEFYVSFSELPSAAGGPRIGGHLPRLRFFDP